MLQTMNEDKLQDTRQHFLIKKWENKKEKISGSDKYRTYMHLQHDRLSYSGLLEEYVNSLETMSSLRSLHSGIFINT